MVEPPCSVVRNGTVCDVQGSELTAWERSSCAPLASAACGLDWAAPTMEDVEFLHLDTILGRFVEDLAERRGMKVHELKDMLKVSA